MPYVVHSVKCNRKVHGEYNEGQFKIYSTEIVDKKKSNKVFNIWKSCPSYIILRTQSLEGKYCRLDEVAHYELPYCGSALFPNSAIFRFDVFC